MTPLEAFLLRLKLSVKDKPLPKKKKEAKK
jgi:hypothetical protein